MEASPLCHMPGHDGHVDDVVVISHPELANPPVFSTRLPLTAFSFPEPVDQSLRGLLGSLVELRFLLVRFGLLLPRGLRLSLFPGQ